MTEKKEQGEEDSGLRKLLEIVALGKEYTSGSMAECYIYFSINDAVMPWS